MDNLVLSPEELEFYQKMGLPIPKTIAEKQKINAAMTDPVNSDPFEAIQQDIDQIAFVGAPGENSKKRTDKYQGQLGNRDERPKKKPSDERVNRKEMRSLPVTQYDPNRTYFDKEGPGSLASSFKEETHKPFKTKGVSDELIDLVLAPKNELPTFPVDETGSEETEKPLFEKIEELVKSGRYEAKQEQRDKRLGRRLKQIGAGFLHSGSDLVYGGTGMGAYALESLVGAVNNLGSKAFGGDGAETDHTISNYYFDKVDRSRKAAEYLTGTDEVKDFDDQVVRSLGGSWIAGAWGPLAVAGETTVSSIAGDVVFDTTDPKYKSLPELLDRTPSSVKPELADNAEQGTLDSDLETSSVYQQYGISPWMVLAPLVAAGGIGTVRRMFKRVPPQSVTIDPALQPKKSGKLPEGYVKPEPLESITDPGTAIQTNIQDANAVVRDYAKKAFGKRADDVALTNYFDELHTMSHVAGQETALASVMNGRLVSPLRNIDMPAPVMLKEAHAKLTPEQQKTFDIGMLALDKLDDIRSGKKSEVVGMSAVQARRLVNIMRKDPVLKNLEAEYRKVTSSIIDFHVDNGLIDAQFAKKLKLQRPGFMPNIVVSKDVDAGILKNMKEAILGDVTGNDDTFKYIPTLNRRDEDIAGRKFLPPMDALMAYVRHNVQLSNTNRLKMKFINMMLTSTDPEVRKSFREVTGKKQIKGDMTQQDRLVTLYVNGQKKRYEVADPLLAKALEFAPTTAQYPLMNFSRKYLQFWLTGHGNPFFAPVVLGREAAQSGIFRPADRSFGYVDHALKYATGGRIGMRGDMTGLIGAVSAIPRDVLPNAALAMSQNIHASLLAGNPGFWGSVDNMFGRGTSLGLADRMRNAYLSSYRGMLDSMGGYNVKQTQYGVRNAVNALDNAKEAWKARFGSAGMSALAAYVTGVESMHNASRLYFFVQNYKPGMTMEQVRKLAAETQKLTGDLRTQGLGPSNAMLKKAASFNEDIRRSFANLVIRSGVGRLNSEVNLYGNPMIQGLAKIGETMRSDPLGFGAGLFNALVVPTVSTLAVGAMLDAQDDGGYLDHFFNRRPEWEKANSIPIYIPGLDPALSPKIEVDPTIGAFMYMTASAIDQIMFSRDWNTANVPGMKFPDPNTVVRRGGSKDLMKNIGSTLGSLVGINLPIPVAAWNAYNGYDTYSGEGFGPGSLYQIKPEQLSGGGEMTDRPSPDSSFPIWLRTFVNETHGAIGGMAMSAIDAGSAGYENGGVKDALDAVTIQMTMNTIKGLRYAKPITGFHTEYASRESGIRYEYQRAADNLADVIRAQITKGGVDIRERKLKPIPEITTEEGADALTKYVAQSGRRLQPIRNGKFLDLIEQHPEFTDAIMGDDYGLKTMIDTLSVLTKQQKDLRAVNAGNLKQYDQMIRKQGGNPLGTLMNIQKRINELELIKRDINIKYIQTLQALEKEFGFSFVDLDPFKDVPRQQQPATSAAPTGQEQQ